MKALTANMVILCGALAAASLLLYAIPAHAQTAAQNQLRATILSEITSDPRSQQMTQAQLYALVNALTLQAQQQGVTASDLQYRPTVPGTETGSTFQSCTDLTCSLSHAFGLDGSLPLIPIALFVAAALFILIFSIMREMGHPHAQLPGQKNTPTAN